MNSLLLLLTIVISCVAYNVNAYSFKRGYAFKRGCPGLCPPVTGNQCRGTMYRDSCNCRVCAKQVGQLCGGQDDIEGKCENNLRCFYEQAQTDLNGVKPGRCVTTQRPQVSPPGFFGRFFKYFGL